MIFEDNTIISKLLIFDAKNGLDEKFWKSWSDTLSPQWLRPLAKDVLEEIEDGKNEREIKFVN